MAEQPRDDGRNSPTQRATDDDLAKAAAATGATGAGCLFTALMPWSLIIVVLAIIAIVWFVWQLTTGAGDPPPAPPGA